MQIINIDIIPQKVKPVVNLSQYDNNRCVRFALFEDGEEYTLAGTEIVEVSVRKIDGNICVITPEIGNHNYIDVYFTEQSTACHGESFGEISINSANDTKIGTCNFILNVEISPEFGGIVSQSEIDNLESQIESMTSDVVSEVAPPIIAEMVPTIVGDQYYTKSQVQENYYNKTYIDTNYYNKGNLDSKFNLVKPYRWSTTFYTGQTQKKIYIEDLMLYFGDSYDVQAFASDYGVCPSNIQFIQEEDPETGEVTAAYWQIDFEEAFDHNVKVDLLVWGPLSYHDM